LRGAPDVLAARPHARRLECGQRDVLHARPPKEYDHWAALGNDGWSYAEVLPYFKRFEHRERGADAFHGAGGPYNVAELRDPHVLRLAFVEAAVETGLPRNDDFNGTNQEGVGCTK
jgi:choline dehydrogenase-like flavoprotein